jgi:competence protein ComEC
MKTFSIHSHVAKRSQKIVILFIFSSLLFLFIPVAGAFPLIANQSDYSQIYSITFPDHANYAGDPDFDGYYEDVNGNGRKDFNDIVVLFKNLEWISKNPAAIHFDFNGNGRVDFNDLVRLFKEIDTPVQVQNMSVEFLDVGQGDSIFVSTPNGKTILVDAGPEDMGDRVISDLQKASVGKLDLVVATHPHADHIGGMPAVFRNYTVNNFIDGGITRNTSTFSAVISLVNEQGTPHTVIKRDQLIMIDPSLSIWVLNPQDYPFNDMNDNSVVLKIQYRNASFLLMGDAGIPAENATILNEPGIQSDVLKVGHHGSDNASGLSFLNQVKPKMNIIEVGAGNPYGHPSPVILQRLHDVGSTIFRTDYNGTITVVTNGSMYWVGTEKAYTPPAKETPPDEHSIKVSDLNLEGEWVNITNNGTAPIPLTGWELTDNGALHVLVFPPFMLNGDSTVTVYSHRTGTNSANELYWTGSYVWNNEGDTAYLYDGEGTLISYMPR